MLFAARRRRVAQPRPGQKQPLSIAPLTQETANLLDVPTRGDRRPRQDSILPGRFRRPSSSSRSTAMARRHNAPDGHRSKKKRGSRDFAFEGGDSSACCRQPIDHEGEFTFMRSHSGSSETTQGARTTFAAGSPRAARYCMPLETTYGSAPASAGLVIARRRVTWQLKTLRLRTTRSNSQDGAVIFVDMVVAQVVVRAVFCRAVVSP